MATPNNVPRRALLQGALALTAVPVATAAGTAFDTAPEPAETPIQALFREWSACYSWLNTTQERFDWDGAEWDARFAVLDEIENRMEAQTATPLHDLALKLAATTSFGCVEVADSRDGEVLAILGLDAN